MMRFAKLFEVQILHDYHLNMGNILHEALKDEYRTKISEKYSVRNYLEIRPAPETVKVMAGYHLLFKQTEFGFFVGVKLDNTVPDKKPAIPLDEDFKLRFQLKIKEPGFINYTVIPTSAPRFYRFSNESGNESANELFLTLPVEPFATDRAYQANEIYATPSESTFDLFRAIRDTGPSSSPVAEDWEQLPATTLEPGQAYSTGEIVLSNNRLMRALIDDPGIDPANWEIISVLSNQYATGADSLTLRPGRFNLDINGITTPRATVCIYKPAEPTPVWRHFYSADTGNLTTLSIDLHTLAAGRYRLELLDSDLNVIPNIGFEFYLDSQAANEGWFGVIEISKGSGNHSLLDDSNVLRTPLFKIRFLNRASRWRYIFPQDQPVGTGAEVAPEANNKSILITANPRPLTLFGQGVRLQADLVDTRTISEEVILPRPEANRIQYRDMQWFSETHMSNLPL